MDKAHLVGQLGPAGRQVGERFAALSARPEAPARLGQVALLPLKSYRGRWHWLAIAANQLRLVIERIEVANRTRAKDHEDPARLGRDVRRPRCQGRLGPDRRAEGTGAAGEQ